MLKIILITHGTFSQGLLNSVEMILGKQEKLLSYSVVENCNTDDLKTELVSEIENAKATEDDVLFLSDVFFGTPFNIVTALMEDYKFHHITGVNLPLLIEIVSNKDADDITAMLKEALLTAQEAMINCVDFFNKALEP